MFINIVNEIADYTYGDSTIKPMYSKTGLEKWVEEHKGEAIADVEKAKTEFSRYESAWRKVEEAKRCSFVLYGFLVSNIL